MSSKITTNIRKVDAVIEETGEVLSLLVYGGDKVVGNAFVKVYKGDWYKGLTLHGYRMLFWILNNVKPNTDYIDLYLEDFSSKGEYYSGIKNLIENSVLYASDRKHRYAINKKCIFNGKTG